VPCWNAVVRFQFLK